MTAPNDTERLCLIANPHSAAGATGRKLDQVRRAAERWFSDWELRTTDGPGHAIELAAAAVAEGFDLVAAVGGDGTANEVANGLFDGESVRDPDTVFTVIRAGTGSDLVKTLGMPRDIDEGMRIAAHGTTRASDVAWLSLTDADTGDPITRIGVNVAGFGLQGEIVHRVNQGSKRLGGTVTFLGATISGMLRYTPTPVTVQWRDAGGEEGDWRGTLMSCFVANGRYCGGGMQVSTDGSMQDGALDLMLIPDLPMLRMVSGLPRLYDGTGGRIDGVIAERVREVEAVPHGSEPVRVDIDGEQPGVLPLRIRTLAGVLPVRGAWGA